MGPAVFCPSPSFFTFLASTQKSTHSVFSLNNSNMSKDLIPITPRDQFWKDPFFSSTWGDFDKMRTDMMAQSKDFWTKVDSDFANFDEMVKKQHSEMDSQMAVQMPQIPRWAVPEEVKGKWAPMLARQDSSGEVILFLKKNKQGNALYRSHIRQE